MKKASPHTFSTLYFHAEVSKTSLGPQNMYKKIKVCRDKVRWRRCLWLLCLRSFLYLDGIHITAGFACRWLGGTCQYSLCAHQEEQQRCSLGVKPITYQSVSWFQIIIPPEYIHPPFDMLVSLVLWKWCLLIYVSLRESRTGPTDRFPS